MALHHKWDVKNGFAYVLQFFSLIFDGLGSVRRIISIRPGPCAIVAEDNGVIVFCCNVAWIIEPDNSGCQQDSVVCR